MSNETVIRVQVWGIIVAVLAVLGFFFVSGVTMEGRVTKCETSISYIVNGMDEMKGLMKEIRNDQIRRQQRENR